MSYTAFVSSLKNFGVLRRWSRVIRETIPCLKQANKKQTNKSKASVVERACPLSATEVERAALRLSWSAVSSICQAPYQQDSVPKIKVGNCRDGSVVKAFTTQAR